MRLFPVIRLSTFLVLSVLTCSPVVAQNNGGRHRVVPRTGTKTAAFSAEAVKALLLDSNLQRARTSAAEAIASTRPDMSEPPQSTIDAWFVAMETAALQGDGTAELDAALRLCEMRAADGDPRVAIAAARVLDNAANTTQFRAAVPRIRALVRGGTAQSSYLRAALLTAAKDGLPGLSVLRLAQASGLITNWSVVGPFGKYSNISFDRSWPPEKDMLRASSYGDKTTERFHFDDGTFELPGYLSGPGTMYAAAEFSTAVAAQYTVRVESPGTFQLFVDKTQVIDKDDRLRLTPEVTAGTVQLPSGRHRVVIKFIANATPFRVAVVPVLQARPTAVRAISSPVEAAYVSAARDYWSGDYGSAITQLTEMRRKQPSAAIDLLLAAAWEHVDNNSTQPVTLAQEALKLAPSSVQAERILAENAAEQQRLEEAVDRARHALQLRPDFEPALRVLAASAAHLHWNADAIAAYDSLAKLHPSCTVLAEASELAATLSEFDRAQEFESRLASCAPGSFAWADALRKAGDHARAADSLNAIVAERPLDRSAREFLVRELALAGSTRDALREAEELVRIAPGSADFRVINEALHRGELPIKNESAMTGFADSRQFYAPYQRDSVTVLKETANRHFSGGPAVVLLHDRVAQLTSDGHVNLYVHKITRVLNRDGILQYGEVNVPKGASILALRTMKTDGGIEEPEISQHKATISMPALAAGDAIDVEYVLRYPDGDLDDHNDAFEFTFGSFAAPILLSRFVVLSPAEAHLQFEPSGEVPSARLREENGQVAREWERNNMAQSVSEISMPRTGLLPSIRVLPEAPDGWAGIRDRYRDALIDAIQIGNTVESVAASIGGGTEEQKMRAAYRFVTTRVRQSSTLFDGGASAEKTLSNFSGNRTAALLAIAQAIGIRVDLVMGRDAALPKPEAIGVHAYTHPLVLFYCRDATGARKILIDAETEGIGFGGIAPTIERDDALLVSLQPHNEASVIVSLPAPILEDRSNASADVSFDSEGNLTSTLEIRMGAARSAQMRAILSGVEAINRKHFFEQLATRIFPGATDASGEVRNEFDSDNPLVVIVRCRAPHFLKLSEGTAEMDQLAPALGLRKMYASAGARREPLLIDTPLIETAIFRIRIPEHMRYSTFPSDVNEQNAFGSYSVRFAAVSPYIVEVRREFRVPVQVIQPEQFDAFSRFARRIDDAERQRLTLERLDQVSVNHRR